MDADIERMRAHLAAIIDSSDDAILSKDLVGTVLSWNRSAERLYGYSAAEMVGRSIKTLLPSDRPDEVDEILERIQRGEVVDHFETERVHKDGHRIPVSLTISPVRDGSGTIVAASTIARDISERQRLERELQRARDQAVEATQLKSDFLATMSHEIRTPMNGVIGMIGMLLDTDLDPRQREYADTARASAEGLLAIINDILDFSKIEAGKLELEMLDFDLRAIVEEVADLLAPQAHGKGLELATVVDSQVPKRVRGDAGRLRQILTNLIGNAIKFTASGEVVARARVAEEDAGQVVVRFDISDTGVGIAPQARSRLFDSFTQADTSTTRTHGGTGLGLTISKQLVHLMGGDIDVESEVGQGSTFTFTVRLTKRPDVVAQKPAEQRHLKGLRVLIVDDNETNRMILEHQVSSWGMETTAAADGTAALQLLRDAAGAGDPFHLGLLDMEMPGMDGLQLAKSIRADSAIAAIPLVLLTSTWARGSVDQVQDAGFAAFLTKPVRQSQLYDCLATVLGTAAAPAATDRPLITQDTLIEARAQARPRLLVAEDNQVNQKVAVAMLSKIGYRCDVVANGAEAVEAVSRTPYGAILMDCQMPEMDGYQATTEIRSREQGGSRIPIIAMTAAAMSGEREKCLAVGMDDYISKPVSLDDLATVLGRWVSAPTEDVDVRPDGGAAGAAWTAVLDRSVVAQLRDLGKKGHPDAFTELSQLFLKEGSQQMERLRDAIVGGDRAGISHQVHALKGGSGTVGAVRLAQRCRELEEAIASNQRRIDVAALAPLEEEFANVRNAIAAALADS